MAETPPSVASFVREKGKKKSKVCTNGFFPLRFWRDRFGISIRGKHVVVRYLRTMTLVRSA